jgi:hypothetical protein
MFSKVLIIALAVAVNCQLDIPRNKGRYLTIAPKVDRNLVLGDTLGLRNTAILSSRYAEPAISTLALRSPAISNIAYAAPALATYGTGYNTLGLTRYAAPALSSLAINAAPALSTYGTGYTTASLGNLNIARGLSVSQAGPVNAAVQTLSRTVDYRPVPYTGEAPVVQDIDVPPMESPIRINFQSRSSPLAVSQQHVPAEPGQVQTTQSEDEPQKVVHNVVRPVVQQINEVIQPFRTLHQTVDPVTEQIHSTFSQGEGIRLSGLTSGVVGGTGVLAASGYGIAAPAVQTVAAPVAKVAVSQKVLDLNNYRTAVAAPAGVIGLNGIQTVNTLGLANAGLYGSRLLNTGLNGIQTVNTLGLANAGLYGSGVLNTGLYGLNGIQTVRSLGLANSGYQLVNSPAYTTGLSTYGLNTKLALDDLSGLSGAKIVRF